MEDPKSLKSWSLNIDGVKKELLKISGLTFSLENNCPKPFS